MTYGQLFALVLEQEAAQDRLNQALDKLEDAKEKAKKK